MESAIRLMTDTGSVASWAVKQQTKSSDYGTAFLELSGCDLKVSVFVLGSGPCFFGDF